MCGIAGILRLNGAPVRRDSVDAMMRLQSHRGPDGHGFFEDDGDTLCWTHFDGREEGMPRPGRNGSNGHVRLGMGHGRLAIIDLTSAGHQPMADPSRRYWIVYNGELYNYIELRKELEAAGRTFHTRSDTEVVLEAYIAWGADCLARFNGMWGLAIWDAERRTLFCARDRFGIKPFYYYFNGSDFIFASEIKSILANRSVSRALDDGTVIDYLLAGNVDHLPGRTFLSEIHALQPGHAMTVSESGLKTERYWDIRAEGERRPFSQELVEECRDLIRDAIRVHLRSDVPVGITLSGGIDSSTLACIAGTLNNDSAMHAFSSLFPGHRNDESRYVQSVVEHGNRYKLHTDSPTSHDLIEDLPRLMWHQDEPFGDTSIYAHYRLMRLARENGIKVILTGQGADEIFAGYGSYHRAFLGQLLATGQLGRLGHEINARNQIVGEKRLSLLRAATYHALPPGLRTKVQSWALARECSWLRPAIRRAATSRERFDPVRPGWSRLDWYLYESIQKWSIPHLVHYDDRNSMAFGVESRVPFLDYRLVDLLFSVDDNAKIRDGRMKTLLRDSSKGLIPDLITSRTDKIGFFTPMGSWLREARPLINDLLETEFARNNPYIEPTEFRRMVDGLLDHDRQEYASPVWWGLSVYLWHQVMVSS